LSENKRGGRKRAWVTWATPTLGSRNLRSRSRRRTSARWPSFFTYAQPPSPLHTYIRHMVPMLVGVEPGLRVLRLRRTPSLGGCAEAPGGVSCSDLGHEGKMLLRLRRLLGRTLGLTLGIAGLLALKLGIARKALLILSGIAALVLVCLLLLALALFGG
jgi:hypothetical protein